MKENPYKPYPTNPIKFLWLFAFRSKKYAIPALLFGAMEICSGKLAPYFFSRITGLFGNDVEFGSIKSRLFLLLALFVLAELLNRVFYYLGRLFSDAHLGPKVMKDVGSELFLYLNNHSVDFFANNMAGNLADKIKNASEVSSRIYVSATYFLKWAFDFVVMIFMFATVNLKFGLLYGACLAVVAFIFLWVSKKVNKKRKEYSDYKTVVAGEFIDIIQNNFFVKIFNAKKHEENRFDRYLNTENRKLKNFVTASYGLGHGQNAAFNIVNIGFLFYAAFLWKNNIISSENLVLVFLLAQFASNTMSAVLGFIMSFNQRLAELEAYIVPFSKEVEIKDIENAKTLKLKESNIRFNNITFGYNKKTKVFKNFSLDIASGQKIGIVGASGCGKSTLINLLQRFYELDSGEILIDKKDIKKVSQDSLRQSISYISQSNQLFKRSIAENICYGKPNAKKDDIIKASKSAYAHSFITKLEDGYNTVLSGDKKLSGGEMQRIAIARALLEDAPILILDEATSALDSQSEQYIQKAIEKLVKNKTVIAIAHRLSTLKNMDRIIVIEDGEIIEDGSIKDLLKQKGKFFEFWNMQKQIEEQENEPA